MAGSLEALPVRPTLTQLPGGAILAAGGDPSASVTELYSTASSTWATTGSLVTPQSVATAILLRDGRVLATGGIGQAYSPASELYDPTTGTWSVTGPPQYANSISRSALLPHGRALLVGGFLENLAAANAELYDPAAGTWTPIGSMGDARAFFTATTLLDGHVLVAGGFGNTGWLSSAEVLAVGLPIDSSRQPVVNATSSPITLTSPLMLTGSGFRGKWLETSGGSTGASATDAPLVQLQSLTNGQVVWVAPASMTDTMYLSAPVTGISPGWAALTLIVNGIASAPVGTLTIQKATPVISWPTPGTLVNPAPLSASQLNASTTVPGQFVYSPPAGKVLAVGRGQTLSVTFTPTDVPDYALANAQVTIDVVAQGPAFTDDPLQPRQTTIKARHLTELCEQVDTVRGRFSLAGFAWTRSSLTGAMIQAVDVNELRTALNQAYDATAITASPTAARRLPPTVTWPEVSTAPRRS